MPAKRRPIEIEVECCRAPDCCDMRGMLGFLILHLLSKRRMYGLEIAKEIALRKAERPNPGTLYPALRSLESEGLIRASWKGRTKYYRLTPQGEEGLRQAKEFFVQAYGDIVLESM
jgi:PadR family transcriptional regulator PadR